MDQSASARHFKIAIYGAGSLGTVLGAYLAQAGLDVLLVNRNTAHVEGLRAQGAQIRGTVNMTVPVKACLPDEMTGEFDLIFLLTKQLDNPRIIPTIAPLLGQAGVLCTLQNGFPEAAIAEILGAERTFGCAVSWGATLLGGGKAELTSDPAHVSFSIGAIADGQTTTLNAIRDVLQYMGEVEIEHDFRGARWSKLLVNCSFSGMSAVLGATFGEVADNKIARRCAQAIMKECLDVARAAHIQPQPIQGKDIAKLFDYHGPIKQWLSFQLIPFAIRKHRSLKASMLQDLEKGRLTEVDSINGMVSAYGRQFGVPTPFNDHVVKIVHQIEAGQMSPVMANLGEFAHLLACRS
ncbi:2-dehydropantoate 2-reductase [Burkholderiaceae bacterium DAT-1]|nr:2-dehydropantoate 2-reductase [Burkholderiaceae bacterium DAT-1]